VESYWKVNRTCTGAISDRKAGMKMKTARKLTDGELRKLLQAADQARARVSTYADHQRAELEAHARSQFQHARTLQTVRRS